ncbi:MAG: hypothetical protein ACK52I_01005 [Pseudomonadota bacterium]|jgi:hypothetical protein
MNLSEFEGRKRKRKMTQAQIDAEREKSLSKNRVTTSDGREYLRPTKNPTPLKDRIADAVDKVRGRNTYDGHGKSFHSAVTKDYGKDARGVQHKIMKHKGRAR